MYNCCDSCNDPWCYTYRSMLAPVLSQCWHPFWRQSIHMLPSTTVDCQLGEWQNWGTCNCISQSLTAKRVWLTIGNGACQPRDPASIWMVPCYPRDPASIWMVPCLPRDPATICCCVFVRACTTECVWCCSQHCGCRYAQRWRLPQANGSTNVTLKMAPLKLMSH